MFIRREKELQMLKRDLERNGKSMILVYGKRRVGKSTLIAQALKDFNGTVVSHLCIQGSFESNLHYFTQAVLDSLGLPDGMKFSGLPALFDFLKSQNKKIAIVLDEYQYFRESLRGNEMDSYMQGVVDNADSNFKIILCGSYITVMKELLEESSPLFGRFTAILKLEEFDYYDAAGFYENLPVADKVKFYAVFGGSPYVLSVLDYSMSVDENIMHLLIDQNSIVRSYIENVMLREIRKYYDTRIVEIIGNGRKRYSEILNLVKCRDNGSLDKQLKTLTDMEMLKKVFPINHPTDRKKQFYEISDNLMRFYFTYIFGRENLISKLGVNSFFINYIQKSLDTFVSYRLEDMVQQYFRRMIQNGNMHDVLDYGTYWYDDRESRSNGQFDCVLKRAGGYYFYEVKNYRRAMSEQECMQEEAQVRKCHDMMCAGLGFVCLQGFDFHSDRYHLISADEMYGEPLCHSITGHIK